MAQGDFTIRDFQDSDREAFAALNMSWIGELFGIEEEDRRQLEQPETTILAKGGKILIADIDGEVVGTGALIPALHPPSDGRVWGEIVKMGTTPRAQGKGIGGTILDNLIEAARDQGMDCLWLETHNSLNAATKLYERRGFTKLGSGELWESPYSRCNLQMVLKL